MSERVPEGWMSTEISDVRDIADRYSFTGGPFGSNLKSEDYTEKGVRIIQLQNIGDGQFLNKYKIYTSQEKADELKSCNIFPGDIILSKMGDPVARATLIPDFDTRYLMASDGIRLSVDENKYDTKFILESINHFTFRNQAESSSTGSTRKRIGLVELRSLTISLPPLPEQKKIASILTSVDEVIETTQKQIDKLQDLKKATMNELLTKGIGHTEFKDSELGRIPKSWEVVELTSRCKRVCVGFVGTCQPFYRNEGIPLIRTGNLRNGILDLCNTKFVTREFHEKEKKSQLNAGDLLIARHGDFGQTCIVPNELKEANCLNIVIIKPDFNFFFPMFLKYIFNLDKMKDMFEAKAEGSTQKVISTTEIAKSRVVMPPLNEQKEIIHHLLSIDKVLDQKKLKLTQTQSLKKSLMQDLLTGKVRVQVN